MIKIPIKEDYNGFIKDFSIALAEKLRNTCFFTFGSYDNSEECDYGRSDIDGGIILNSGVITPKQEIQELSEILFRTLNDRGIKTQFNLLDRETCRDGRFLSYTADYTDWIKSCAVLHSLYDYLGDMNGRDYKSGVLYSAAFNFTGPGGLRNTLLRNIFVEEMQSALEKAAKFPKKLVWLREGIIVPSRTQAKKRLEKLLGGIDLTGIDEINALLSNPHKFYRDLSDINIAYRLLKQSLSCVELMIDSYLRFFPEVSEKELKI
jgi:hypothetical protein